MHYKAWTPTHSKHKQRLALHYTIMSVHFIAMYSYVHSIDRVLMHTDKGALKVSS
jgi:hypothetical protein